MQTFLLLIDFGGNPENRRREKLDLLKLLPRHAETLFAWPTGQAVGYTADQAINGRDLRAAIGDRGQVLQVEISSPCDYYADGYGRAAAWLNRHVGPPG